MMTTHYSRSARKRRLPQAYIEAAEAFDRGDFASSLRFAEQRSAAGDVYGRLLRAQIYMDGLGVPPDLPRAIEILEEAEALGSIAATYQKAGVFARQNRPKDYFRAIQKAAQAGLLPAKCSLGRCYLEGVGVDRNEARGMEILEEASALGNIRARVLLAYYRAKKPASLLSFAGDLARMTFYSWYCKYLEWSDPLSERLD